jgi:hypothetical protein
VKISVSPYFELETDTLTVTEFQRDGKKTIHSFDADGLPLNIFRDRMAGWFFEPANRLLQIGSDVAAVHIVTPLIEALEERYCGESSKNQSAKFFKRRAKALFGLADEPLNLLYGGLRSGFAHHGFLKDDAHTYNILLTAGLQLPIEYRDEVLWVDSQKYVAQIVAAYQEYYSKVESDPGLRANFLRIWNPDWQMSLRVPGGAGTVSPKTV